MARLLGPLVSNPGPRRQGATFQRHKMTKIAFYSRIVKIEKRIASEWISGVGDNAKFREIDRGYFMTLEGSHESIHIGFDDPMFKAGERIKITFERV